MSAESAPQPKRSQYIRRVILPSGRAIEVVYFDTDFVKPNEPSTELEHVKKLEICPDCDRDLVYPVEWEATSSTHWEVLLRCPNCEWADVDEHDNPTVHRFDRELDISKAMVTRDLGRLTIANMKEEIEVLITALEMDLITADDFARIPNIDTSGLRKVSFEGILTSSET